MAGQASNSWVAGRACGPMVFASTQHYSLMGGICLSTALQQSWHTGSVCGKEAAWYYPALVILAVACSPILVILEVAAAR